MANSHLLPDFRGLFGIQAAAEETTLALIPGELHYICPSTSVVPVIANPIPASSPFPTGLSIKRGFWIQPNNQYRLSQAKSQEFLSPRMLFALLNGYVSFFLQPHGVCVSVFIYTYTSVHFCLLLLFIPSMHQESTGTSSICLSPYLASLLVQLLEGELSGLKWSGPRTVCVSLTRGLTGTTPQCCRYKNHLVEFDSVTPEGDAPKGPSI